MNRVIIIIAALTLGACTTQVVEEETGTVHNHDGTRYVGQGELDDQEPGTSRTFMFRGFGGNTNPAATKGHDDFSSPLEEVSGPFPDPWQGEEPPTNPGKP